MSDNLINELEKIPLSFEDLYEIYNKLSNVKDKIRVMLYDDLEKIKTINELFNNGGEWYVGCILLLTLHNSGSSVGHYIALVNHYDKKKIYYYDSYGLSIEQDLGLAHEHRFIYRLLAGQNVQINPYRHQKFINNVNDCGRMCCLRLLFYHLDNIQYHNLVFKPIKSRYHIDEDAIVSLITGLLSKSDDVLIKFFNKDK